MRICINSEFFKIRLMYSTPVYATIYRRSTALPFLCLFERIYMMKYNSEQGQGLVVFLVFLFLVAICLWLAIGIVPGGQNAVLSGLGL